MYLCVAAIIRKLSFKNYGIYNNIKENIKFLVKKLKKDVQDFYTENYKILREIKDDLDK